VTEYDICRVKVSRTREVVENDLQCTMPYTSAGHSYHHSAEISACLTLTIPELGGFIDDLIEGRKDVIGELDLNHGFRTFCSHPDGGSNDTLLGDGRIEDSVRAKFQL
jgi:hypothetical protein